MRTCSWRTAPACHSWRKQSKIIRDLLRRVYVLCLDALDREMMIIQETFGGRINRIWCLIERGQKLGVESWDS